MEVDILLLLVISSLSVQQKILSANYYRLRNTGASKQPMNLLAFFPKTNQIFEHCLVYLLVLQAIFKETGEATVVESAVASKFFTLYCLVLCGG